MAKSSQNPHLAHLLYKERGLPVSIYMACEDLKGNVRSCPSCHEYLVWLLFVTEASLIAITCVLEERSLKKNSVALSLQANYTDWRPPLVGEI
jgi:hypothetical protein